MTYLERSVGIVGLGLMGGSIARALRRVAAPPRVLGADAANQSLSAALAAGVVDEARDASSVAASADVVIYSAPLPAIVEQIQRHASLWRDDALVMDVCSLKVPVRDAILAASGESRWVGAHPMAGGETSGFDASRPDLFEGSRVWLTRAAPAPELGRRAEAFWDALGARPEWTEPEVHDRVMSLVSHLPQVSANALAWLLDDLGVDPRDLGPGGMDMTRLAGSSSAVWGPLLEASGPGLAPLVTQLSRRLEEVARMLEDGRKDELSDLMERGRAWKERRSWS